MIERADVELVRAQHATRLPEHPDAGRVDAWLASAHLPQLERCESPASP